VPSDPGEKKPPGLAGGFLGVRLLSVARVCLSSRQMGREPKIRQKSTKNWNHILNVAQDICHEPFAVVIDPEIRSRSLERYDAAALTNAIGITGEAGPFWVRFTPQFDHFAEAYQVGKIDQGPISRVQFTTDGSGGMLWSMFSRTQDETREWFAVNHGVKDCNTVTHVVRLLNQLKWTGNVIHQAQVQYYVITPVGLEVVDVACPD
jgi:hypothetical protein